MRGNTDSRTSNTVKNLVTGFGSQILSTILRFIVRTAFISTLGKEYLGISGLFSDLLSMLSLTELGFDIAINYRLYKPLAEKDEKRVRILVKFYKQAYRVIGGIILAIGLCFIPLLPFLIKDYDSLATLGINATVIFILYLLQTASTYLFFAYRTAVMKANQKKYVMEVIGYFLTIISNVSQIITLYTTHSFIAYTIVSFIFVIIINMSGALISTKYYPQYFIEETESITKEERKDLLKDCGALFLDRANNVVLKATDNIVLSKFIGLTIVGLYSNYLMAFSMINNVLNQFYTAVSASMGNLFATEDTQTKYRFFKGMNFLTFLLYGTAAVGIIVCIDEFLVVWLSPEFVIPYPFSILIGIEILLTGISSNLGQIRNASGVFKQLWYRPIMSITVNIVVSIIMVNVCGIYGVIIGTIASYITTVLIIDPSVIYKYSFKNFRPVIDYYGRISLYFAVLFVVCLADKWICSNICVWNNIASLIIHMVITGISVPIALLTVFWRTEGCKYVISIVSRITKKKK